MGLQSIFLVTKVTRVLHALICANMLCSDTYMEPPALLEGKDNVNTICALPRKGAVTYRDFNSITICPFYWDNFNELVKPRPATIREIGQPLPETIPPVFLDYFQTISQCFLHEYTHLIGRGPGQLLPPRSQIFAR